MKRLFFTLCTVLLGVTLASARATMLGDATGDGKVDMTDVVLALRAAIGVVPTTPQILTSSDVFPFPGTDERPIGDGMLDVRDVTRLLQFESGLVSRTDLGPADADSPQAFDLHPGWHADREVVYYDFGMTTDRVARLYALFDAAGKPVAGQRNIITTVPGQSGYSPFWDVQAVTVPAGYTANTLRSEPQVLASGYAIQPAHVIVDCPVVPGGSIAAPLPLTRGWFEGKTVFYFDAGATPRSASDPLRAAAADLDALVTGKTATGDPIMLPGQFNVIDSIPGDAMYSPLWKIHLVTVPTTEKPNTLKSIQAVQSGGFAVQDAGFFVNCPVVMP